jgi:uncharacterized protein (DUF983 family)
MGSLHPQPSARTAILRGLFGRCPRCGEGAMFRTFLKVADRCSVCGEELHHHRADDFPAYIVIVIVGHALVPTVLYVETNFAPSYWVHLALWVPLTLLLSIGLLQPVKGVIVALQWTMGMHGFEQARARVELACSRAAGRTREEPISRSPHRPPVTCTAIATGGRSEA